MSLILEFGKSGEKAAVVASEVIAIAKYQSVVRVHLASGDSLHINESYETARNKLTSYIESQAAFEDEAMSAHLDVNGNDPGDKDE